MPTPPPPALVHRSPIPHPHPFYTGWNLTDDMTMGSLNKPAVRLLPNVLQAGVVYQFQLCCATTADPPETACGTTRVAVAGKLSVGKYVCPAPQPVEGTSDSSPSAEGESFRANEPPPPLFFEVPCQRHEMPWATSFFGPGSDTLPPPLFFVGVAGTHEGVIWELT